ncbi:hypothetical protein [Streptomyces sp. NPDC050856]|uniref:hypothetical protein n=1 Tax=Streptomyces sp. NPDC050856 TaxID=3154939 RepID=UPI003409121E
MASHVTVPGRHRRRHAARRTPRRGWVAPAVLGAGYGVLAQWIERAGDASPTWGEGLLALVAAVVFGALCHGVFRVRRSLTREPRAAAFAALAGVGLGFLLSLTTSSVLTVAVLSLLVAAAVFCVALYLFHTHE